MKKIIALAALIGTIITSSHAHTAAEPVDFYDQLSDNLDIIQVYEVDDLDCETLENRNGNIVIEKIIGQVLNAEGDGKILNTKDDYYNYINYSRVKDAQVGDIILTYCIYNPDTTYTDDIIERFDYIIDRK